MSEDSSVCPECHQPMVEVLRGVCRPCYMKRWHAGTLDQLPEVPKPVREPRTEKVCPICRQVLPLESFGKNNRRPDGRGSYCKPCARVKYHVPARERKRFVERPVDGEQACRKCGEVKPYSEYYWETDKGRYRYRCKSCIAGHGRKYWERTGRMSQRERQLRSKFGMTQVDYDALLAEQGGGCAICGRTPGELGQTLAVDHCHAGGRIRGLLCTGCNCSLGLLGEDLARFSAAVEYLTLKAAM